MILMRRDYPRRRQNDEARAEWLRMVPAERAERRADRLDRQRGLTPDERWQRWRRRQEFRDNAGREWLAREIQRLAPQFVGRRLDERMIMQFRAVVEELSREAERRYRFVPRVGVEYDYARRVFDVTFIDPA
jgi:hypothetical protein